MSISTEAARPAPIRSQLALAWANADVGVIAAGIAAMIFIPWLGSVGLWDPWETHYSEVGREMLARHDFIHPHWENSWFFSKPPMTPWLAALGLWVVGDSGSGELSRYAEWGIRAPFALLSISAVGLLSHAVSRFSSRTAGLACGLALSTMPLFLFTARQAMTDTPFVAFITMSWACALIGQLDTDQSERLRIRWWLGFYGATGAAALSKGLLAGLPAMVWLAWWIICKPSGAILKNLREQISRMELLRGLLIFAIIAVPWYAAMIAFDGKDNEGVVFWRRFFLHDHFDRLFSGVHTTTPGGTFVYFVEQGGYGIFPWVALLPGALQSALGTSLADLSPRARLRVWATTWVFLTFSLFTSSATRFHHYALPLLPALAVLVGLFSEQLQTEGLKPHAMSLLLGLVLFGLVGHDLASQPRHFIDLFTYNQDRPYPDFLLGKPIFAFAPGWVSVRVGLGAFFATTALIATMISIRFDGRGLLVAGGTFSLTLALWLSWGHWVALSPHWTQRDLFSRYWQQKTGDEPIAAFMMDWKGETFYSRNQVVQLGPANYPADLPKYAERPGRKWMLVEQARVQMLRGALGREHSMRIIESSFSNKFVLLTID